MSEIIEGDCGWVIEQRVTNDLGFLLSDAEQERISKSHPEWEAKRIIARMSFPHRSAEKYEEHDMLYGMLVVQEHLGHMDLRVRRRQGVIAPNLSEELLELKIELGLLDTHARFGGVSPFAFSAADL